MATIKIKALYLDSNGVYQSITNTADGVLLTNSNGDLTSAKVADANIADNAAIANSKLAGAPTNQNTVNTIVLRDSSGNFSAGTITADLTGNASSATYATSAGSAATATNAGHATTADSATTATNAGHATTADSATTAGSANSADYATNAGSAATATTATNADHATSADSATNATSATFAASAGSAATATNADHATSADSATSAGYATSAGSALTATSADSATTAGYATSAGSATTAGYATTAGSATSAGNASTADQLTTARTISLSGGVSGSGNFDGSAPLTISTTVDSVGDGALSSNVALYDAATPSFSSKLGVGTPTASDTNSAATVGFVIQQVQDAVSGVDYKQECQYFFDGINPGLDLASLLTIINTGVTFQGMTFGPINGTFHVGDRLLLLSGTATESGIYVFGNTQSPPTDGHWTLAYASDFKAGTDAAGAYTFCVQQFQPNPQSANQNHIDFSSFNTAYICSTPKSSAVIGTDPLTFVVFGAPTVYTAGNGISISNNQISANLAGGSGINLSSNNGQITISAGIGASNPLTSDGSNIGLSYDSATLGLSGSSLTVSGVPSMFKIGGTGTSTTVSAANLDALTGSNAQPTTLHAHSRVQIALSDSTSIGAGYAVAFNGATVTPATQNDGKFVGIVVESGASAYVATSGSVVVASAPTGAGVGDNVYLDNGGNLCAFGNLPSNKYATKVGKYLGGIGPAGAPMISISVQEFGIKP
jgi:hypothetical protein